MSNYNPLSSAQSVALMAGRNNPEYYAQWSDGLDNREWQETDWLGIVAELGEDEARTHSRDLFADAVFEACRIMG